MQLFTNIIGPGPRRIALYIAMKQIRDIEMVIVKTTLGEQRTPEFLEKVPAGRLPVLRTDEGVYLPESQAILQFLEERYPDPPMHGSSEAARRREDVQMSLITEYYHHAMMTFSHQSPYVSLGQPHRDYQWKPAYEIGLVTRPFWWSRLEQIATLMGASRFLAGESPTLCDIMLFALLEYMRALYDMFIPPHNRALFAWYDRFRALPGVTPLQVDQAHFDQYIARYGTRI